MSENNNRKSETYAEVSARKVSYGAFSTPNTPNGCYIGTEFDPESPDAGKFVLLNSRYNRTPYYDRIPAQDETHGFDEYFAEIAQHMIDNPEANLWQVVPEAVNYVHDMREAQAAGQDLDSFRADREARIAAEKAEAEKAKTIRARAKELGLKVGKNGSEMTLTGDTIAQFAEFMQAQKAKGELGKIAEFARELAENSTES